MHLFLSGFYHSQMIPVDRETTNKGYPCRLFETLLILACDAISQDRFPNDLNLHLRQKNIYKYKLTIRFAIFNFEL